MSDPARVYVLADVDAMYCSVEQVLAPGLRHRPLVVLSNNDGCVIARSAEAKAAGIAAGQPWSRVRGLPGLAARSANFELYGDFSARLHAITAGISPGAEPYSIDEWFLALPDARTAWRAAWRLRERAAAWLGLPVSAGTGPTKTLAKLAARLAKDRGAGVLDLASASPRDMRDLLGQVPAGAVWGIGPALEARLAAAGITTAAGLASADPRWARAAGTVTLERTVRELQGTPCIPLNSQPPPRRQMMHCRTLARPLTCPDDAAAAAAAFAQALAARLRRRGLAAATLSVLLSGSGSRTAAQALPAPSSGAAEWAAVAAALARRLWQPGTRCTRIGVLALDLAPARQAPGLLAGSGHARDARLSETIDAITARYGPASIALGHAGLRKTRPWTPRQQHLSPAWTTRWDQLPLVR